MEKTTYKGYKVGDRVTVKQSQDSYDGGPIIEPGVEGTIKAFPPKTIVDKDRDQYFAYVEFDKTYESRDREYYIRGGVYMNNLKKVLTKSLKEV